MKRKIKLEVIIECGEDFYNNQVVRMKEDIASGKYQEYMKGPDDVVVSATCEDIEV